MKKALFIRLDRMGDLILTLPCDRLVEGSHQAHWLIPKGLDFVPQSTRPSKSFDSLSSDWSFANFRRMRRLLKDIRPDVSISYHVPWWINFTLWLSRVKVRGGVLSQWHSYLFLNKGLRQKRSRCEHHEMEYNYLLTEYVFDLKSDPSQWLPIELIEDPTKEMQFNVEQEYYVVHPGMGGSALNWPTDNYVRLINQLTDKAPVVITGTQSDEVYLKPLKMALKDNHQVVWLDRQLDGYQLLKLLKNAKANVAPSTGVLHLSAALGAPSFGIYSPIKVHRSERWGPKGLNTQSFTPKVKCPAHFECLKEACAHYPCMAKMSTEPVASQVLSQ